jgi:hypothetical protein
MKDANSSRRDSIIVKEEGVSVSVYDFKGIKNWVSHVLKRSFTPHLPRIMISKPLAGTFRVCTSTFLDPSPFG